MKIREYLPTVKENLPRLLYIASDALSLLAMGPNGGLNNPYNTINLGVAYLVGKEIRPGGNSFGKKGFRDSMIIFGACLAIPVIYNSLQRHGIAQGDLLFDAGIWAAAWGAHIEMKNLEVIENNIESRLETPDDLDIEKNITEM